MTALSTLAGHLTQLRFDELGADVVDAARKRVFDSLSAASIGLATPEGRLVRQIDERVREVEGAPTALDRCRLLVAATRTTEIDDIDIGSCATVGAVVVPVAVSIAAHRSSVDDRDLITAVVAGYEAMIRLGRAIDGAHIIYRGVWPTYVTAAFASAAIMAKLLGYSADLTANALGLALSRTFALSRSTLTHTGYRYYALGCATAEGCVAALAAEAGLRCASDSLETYGAVIGAEVQRSELVDNFPASPKILEVDTKFFPGSRQAMSSVEAFMAQMPVDIHDIDDIEVYVPSAYRDMVDQPAMPGGRIASMLGVQYQMALAAINSECFYDVIRKSLPSNADIDSLMNKIVVHPDDALSNCFPRRWGSRVTVRLRSGTTTTTEVIEPGGAASNRPSWDSLCEKLEKILVASVQSPGMSFSDLLQYCRSLGDDSKTQSAGRLLDQINWRRPLGTVVDE